MRPAVAAVAVAAVAAAATLSGCLATPFGDDPTSSTSSATSTSESPTSSSPTPTEDFSRASRELTDAEAKGAIPPKPKGYRQEPLGSGKQQTTDPAQCVDVLRLGWQGRNARRARTGGSGVIWHINGNSTQRYQSYSVKIESHSKPVNPAYLDRAGDALGSCESFSLTGKQAGADFDERVLAEALPVRNIGEQTFAVRLTTFATIKGRSEKIFMDQLVFRVGRNLVTVTSGSYHEGRNSVTRVEDLAEETLDNLQE